MTRPKADTLAADRVLRAAVRRGVTRYRAGENQGAVAALLHAATIGAGLLIDDEPGLVES